MSSSIFNDKNSEPDKKSLQLALGDSYMLYEEIIKFIEENWGKVIPEWKIYSVKSGWLLKTLLKKRNLFFLIPLQEKFDIGFVFGDKAVNAINRSELSSEIKNEVKSAKKYAEGRGLRFTVDSAELLETAKTLIHIKINN